MGISIKQQQDSQRKQFAPRSAKLRFLRREAVAVSKDDSTDLANGSRVPEVDLRANYVASGSQGPRPHLERCYGLLIARYQCHDCVILGCNFR